MNPEDNVRIAFHEITAPAIKEAIKHPGPIDLNRVDAQQARRVLDRLVGYKLSPGSGSRYTAAFLQDECSLWQRV